jgi:hypothetical protein
VRSHDRPEGGDDLDLGRRPPLANHLAQRFGPLRCVGMRDPDPQRRLVARVGREGVLELQNAFRLPRTRLTGSTSPSRSTGSA